MNSESCILGHAPSMKMVLQEADLQARKCAVCGLLHFTPHDRRSEPLANNSSSGAKAEREFDPDADLAAKAYLGAFYSTYPNYHTIGEKPTSLLVIGCRTRRLLKLARDAGLETCSLETDVNEAKYIEKELGMPCETNPLSSHSFGDRKFDIIFHSNVTPQLDEPLAAFKTMHAKLAAHGQLVFETGNGADIDPRHYKYLKKWRHPDDLFAFGEESIRQLLKQAGFTRIHIVSWSVLPELRLGMGPSFPAKSVRAASERTSNAGTANRGGLSGRRKSKRVARALARFRFFLRFTLGALSSDRCVPRTMLVWAMK